MPSFNPVGPPKPKYRKREHYDAKAQKDAMAENNPPPEDEEPAPRTDADTATEYSIEPYSSSTGNLRRSVLRPDGKEVYSGDTYYPIKKRKVRTGGW